MNPGPTSPLADDIANAPSGPVETHIVAGKMKEGRKKMFYLRTHSTHFIYGYMASFRLAQGFFYMHHPTDRIAHTTAFVTPVVEHWLEREIAQWVHH